MEGEAAGEWQQVAGRVDRSGWRVPHHVAIHRTFESSWEMVTKELIRLSKITKNQMYPAGNVPLSIFINTKENKSCSCSINASLLIVVIKITLVTWRKRIFNQMSNVRNTFDIVSNTYDKRNFELRKHCWHYTGGSDLTSFLWFLCFHSVRKLKMSAIVAWSRRRSHHILFTIIPQYNEK